MSTARARSGPDMTGAPLMIEDVDAFEWDGIADVIVVGFGGAGAAAAVEAAERGADVLAIDRFGGGGATAYSGGVIYACGTRQQKDAGFDDPADEMFKYLSAEGSPLGAEALRRFCEGSSGDVAWLEGHGVPYGDRVYHPKTAYPPPGYSLFFSGNERLPRFEEVARPAPRGHLPVTPGFGGHLHHARLADAARALGVRRIDHAPVTGLIVDRNGATVGVEVNRLPDTLQAEHQRFYQEVNPWKPLQGKRSERAIARCHALEAGSTARQYYRARGGVILATGGFIYNLAMLEANRPLLARSYEGLLRLGSMGCDGSGIRLGQSAGGDVGLMDRFFLGRPLAPPEAFIYGLMVNVAGERFINEDAYQSLFGDRLAEQPEGGKAWLILDSGHFWKGVRQSLFPGKGLFWLWGAPALLNIAMGGTRRGATLARLARRIGVDPKGLERTIDDWNARAAAGDDDPLGKSRDKLVPLGDGPFYAVNVALDNRYGPTFAFSVGGLVVDDDNGLVKRKDGSTIEGLYAAGRAAVGLCSMGYMTGLAIADTVFSGRRAGRHAADRSSATPPAAGP